MSTKSTYNENELLASLRRKDGEAFTYLYDQYSAALYGVIRQIVAETDIANEVLQESFINIWRRIDTYDENREKLFTWMLQIARNAAIDKIRIKNAAGIKQLSSETEIVQPAARPGLDDYGLKKLIYTLKDEHLQLIDLSYFQGYTHEQIAQAMHMPLGTVKTRIRSALSQLRALLS